MLVVQLRKQIITQKLLKLKRNLQIIVMINILLLQYFTAEVFDARLERQNQVTTTDFGNKLKRLNEKINSSKTKTKIN